MSFLLKAAPMTEIDPATARFIKRIGESYQRCEYADAKITCRGKEFKAIKFVLCQQSETFADMFKDVKDGNVDLSDEDPAKIAEMLYFCHNFTYGVGPIFESSSSPLVTHVRLYVAALKYRLPELEVMALKNFRKSCLADWAKPAFAEAIEEAYKKSDHAKPREIVCLVAMAARSELVSNRDKYEQFWETVLQIPEFARDMLLTDPQSRQALNSQRYVCPACSAVICHNIQSGESYEHDCKNKPWSGSKKLTEFRAQDLFLNARGRLVGGLPQGFYEDEMPKFSALKSIVDGAAADVKGDGKAVVFSQDPDFRFSKESEANKDAAEKSVKKFGADDF